MERIAAFLVHRSKVVLALTGLTTLLFIAALFRMDINADITEFLTSGSERGRAYAELGDKYGGNDPLTVLLEARSGEPGFDDRSSLAELVRVGAAIDGVDGVGSVASAVPLRNPLTGEAITPELIETAPAFIFDRLVDGPGAELMLAEDRRAALLMVTPAAGEDAVAMAQRVAATPLTTRFDVVLAGNPMVLAEVIDMLGWFLLAIPPLVIVLLLAVFYATIGQRKLAALSLMPAILGSIWTFGTIFALGYRVDIVTAVVPIFVIVMGSADGLHFVAHYRDEVARTEDEVERVKETLAQVGVPMILTTLSTAAGFLSLLATDVRPMRQMGVFVAMGIGFAGLISFFTLPALLSRLPVKPNAKPAPLGAPLMRAVRLAVRRRATAVVFLAATVGFAAAFLPRLEVSADPLFFFKADSEVRASFERVERAFGGAMPLTGEFVFDPSAQREPQLERMRGLERELEHQPGVRRVFSVADAEQSLGAMPAAIRDKLFAAEGVPGLGRLVSEDGARFVLFPGKMKPDDVQTWLAFVDAHDEIRVLTGMPVLFDEISRIVVDAQVGSLSVAFGLVGVLLFAAYRRLRPTLTALVPIALTTAVVLAFMAAVSINLHLMTAIAASIVIGVGIDYAIHFIAAIEYARRRHGDHGWLEHAVHAGGPPIAANALGVAAGMSALLLSPLQPHNDISKIMWAAMTVAALAAFLLIPLAYPRDPDTG